MSFGGSDTDLSGTLAEFAGMGWAAAGIAAVAFGLKAVGFGNTEPKFLLPSERGRDGFLWGVPRKKTLQSVAPHELEFQAHSPNGDVPGTTGATAGWIRQTSGPGWIREQAAGPVKGSPLANAVGREAHRRESAARLAGSAIVTHQMGGGVGVNWHRYEIDQVLFRSIGKVTPKVAIQVVKKWRQRLVNTEKPIFRDLPSRRGWAKVGAETTWNEMVPLGPKTGPAVATTPTASVLPLPSGVVPGSAGASQAAQSLDDWRELRLEAAKDARDAWQDRRKAADELWIESRAAFFDERPGRLQSIEQLLDALEQIQGSAPPPVPVPELEEPPEDFGALALDLADLNGIGSEPPSQAPPPTVNAATLAVAGGGAVLLLLL